MMLNEKEHQGKTPYFTGIDNARFRKAIVPGDQIIIEVEVIRLKGNVGKVKAVAKVDNQIAAEADLMFILGE
jgi:3-hydroxyacyl-[acyl-carrier-protein] dehydratase